MRKRWVRHRPNSEESRRAVGIAAGVGLAVGGALAVVTWYLGRILIPRERIDRPSASAVGPHDPGPERLRDGEEE